MVPATGITSFLVAGKNSSIKGQDKALVFIGELKIHGKEFAEFLVAFRQDVIIDDKAGDDILFVVDDKDLETLFERSKALDFRPVAFKDELLQRGREILPAAVSLFLVSRSIDACLSTHLKAHNPFSLRVIDASIASIRCKLQRRDDAVISLEFAGEAEAVEDGVKILVVLDVLPTAKAGGFLSENLGFQPVARFLVHRPKHSGVKAGASYTISRGLDSQIP